MITKDCMNLTNCICKSVIKIDRLQNKTDCTCEKTIVPIILYSKDFTPLKAFGNVGDVEDDCFGCFETSIFKIEYICKTTCCGKLSLLRPIDEHGSIAKTICETFRLEETDFCIDVNFHCFCALQRLSMALVNRPLGGIIPK
ncbi:CotY/CotZ family spore coat protein [Halalkalibacter okhensis]|uniref:CotY/CotZ family spore coat protein n=1 Tax=Halalkalibacter okhensis TaxID=333138 RepID=UPI000689BE8D|nr:CotY/CotZ family spore coat protein [Halalkalibacter okhensis]